MAKALAAHRVHVTARTAIIPPLPLSSGTKTPSASPARSRQEPSRGARLQTGERAGIDLVGLYVSLGDCLHLQRIGDNHPRHEWRQNPRQRLSNVGWFPY